MRVKSGRSNKLFDWNGTQLDNLLIHRQRLHHLAKLTNWVSCAMNPLDYVLLSCHISILKRIYTQQLPDCQGTPCSKQAQYLNFKWRQRAVPSIVPKILTSPKSLSCISKLCFLKSVLVLLPALAYRIFRRRLPDFS